LMFQKSLLNMAGEDIGGLLDFIQKRKLYKTERKDERDKTS
jgi:hypothetical protein